MIVPGRRTPPPASATYTTFQVGPTSVTALADHADRIREALGAGTLHDYAARHPARRSLAGRGPVYVAPLPGGGPRVVVRRSRHGGLFAPLTGDLFLPPTRAARELETAQRLAELGIPTPQVVAVAIYRAGPLLRRSDVVTREVPDARDLGEALRQRTGHRELWAAAARLIAALTKGGVRHPDLNVKNILLTATPECGLRAKLLDVDRVVFGRSCDPAIARANLDRLERSARKWRDRERAPVDDRDLDWLREIVQRLAG